MTQRNPITMLRGFLALAIIWEHLQPVPVKLLNVDFSFLTFIPGRIIVWLFFLVSGFSIYSGYRTDKYSINVRDIFRFYFNRAIRILPLFYLTVLSAWICRLYLSPSTLPPWRDIVRTMFFLNFNFRDGIHSFAPTWFIGVLVDFYICSPFLVKGYMLTRGIFSTRSFFILLVGISAVSTFLGYLCAGSLDIRNFIGGLPLFLFGFFAFDLFHDESGFLRTCFRQVPRKLVYFILLILFELTFFLYYNRSLVVPSSSLRRILLAPFALLIEAYIGTLGVILVSVLLTKTHSLTERKWHMPLVSRLAAVFRSVFHMMGQQAFGLYLWHSIVILFLFQRGWIGYIGPPFRSLFELFAAFIMTTVITYLISLVFFHLLEKPYHNLYRTRKYHAGKTAYPVRVEPNEK